MWLEFLRAIAVCVVLFYGPGFLFFKGLGLSRTLSFFVAPLYIACVSSALPIAYYKLDIPCNAFTILGPVVALACILFFARAHIARKKRELSKPSIFLDNLGYISLPHLRLPFDVAIPTLVVVVATMVCFFVFIQALPGADAFNPRYDNQTHLNLARAYMDSGKWSSLHSSTFLASPEPSRSFASLNVFYPGAWTCLVVLTSLVAQADLMVSINAVVALTAAVVFPLGMYAFIRTLLPRRRRAVVLGAFAITGFAHWPWLYILTGPLYPNQLGIALQFGALAVLLAAFKSQAMQNHRTCVIVFCLVAFFALALTHPSTIFSLYVFMAFFGIHVLRRSPLIRSMQPPRRLFVYFIYAGAVIAFWAICLELPMLQSTVRYTEVIRDDLRKALFELATMRFSFLSVQIGMAIASAVGCIVTIRKNSLRWLLGPIMYFAIGYIATRTDWWIAKHWLTSLWYSDWRRMCANMTLYLMPLAALGLDAILPRHLPRINAANHKPKPLYADFARRALPILRVLCFATILFTAYLPHLELSAAHVSLKGSLAHMSEDIRNRHAEQIYSSEEVAFSRKALTTISSDALVINSPADGSMWAYGVCGLNTYYRSILLPGLTEDANLIRENLVDFARDPKVRDAVRRTGARYVLQLDKNVSYADGHWIWQFSEEMVQDWRGIDAIDEGTPGFSLVLAEGSDMRLYRIDAH